MNYTHNQYLYGESDWHMRQCERCGGGMYDEMPSKPYYIVYTCEQCGFAYDELAGERGYICDEGDPEKQRA